MVTYKCPICGTPLALNSSNCSSCRTGLSWIGGQPSTDSNSMSSKQNLLIFVSLVFIAISAFLFFSAKI